MCIPERDMRSKDCIHPLMAMSKCAAPEIEPDDIEVSDTVAFTWEIQ